MLGAAGRAAGPSGGIPNVPSSVVLPSFFFVGSFLVKDGDCGMSGGVNLKDTFSRREAACMYGLRLAGRYYWLNEMKAACQLVSL